MRKSPKKPERHGVLVKPVSELKPDPNNANLGNDRGAEMIDSSLRRYGAGRSILLDKNGVVIAGNKTLQHAAQMGIEEVVVIQSDGKRLVAVQRSDLDLNEAAARGLAIADNRTGEVNLAWSAAELARLKEAMPEALEGMFSEAELKKVLATAPENFPEVDENIPIAHVCPKCGYQWSGKPA